MVPSAWNSERIIVALKNFLRLVLCSTWNRLQQLGSCGRKWIDGWMDILSSNMYRQCDVVLDYPTAPLLSFRCERCQATFTNSSCVCNPPNILVSSASPRTSYLFLDTSFISRLHNDTYHEFRVVWLCMKLLLLSSEGRRIMFPSRRSLYQCESKCQLCTIGTFPSLFAKVSVLFIQVILISIFFSLIYLFFFLQKFSVQSAWFVKNLYSSSAACFVILIFLFYFLF